jgi:hypothetical protein
VLARAWRSGFTDAVAGGGGDSSGVMMIPLGPPVVHAGLVDVGIGV